MKKNKVNYNINLLRLYFVISSMILMFLFDVSNYYLLHKILPIKISANLHVTGYFFVSLFLIASSLYSIKKDNNINSFLPIRKFFTLFFVIYCVPNIFMWWMLIFSADGSIITAGMIIRTPGGFSEVTLIGYILPILDCIDELLISSLVFWIITRFATEKK